jgi:hypothetical protein|tara:strand:- start:157 stop:531 length:375 start_codon:yes stop_codon:yes gene_type:complete
MKESFIVFVDQHCVPYLLVWSLIGVQLIALGGDVVPSHEAQAQRLLSWHFIVVSVLITQCISLLKSFKLSVTVLEILNVLLTVLLLFCRIHIDQPSPFGETLQQILLLATHRFKLLGQVLVFNY